MGREVKRVPLDWDWPIGKVWPGGENPFYCDEIDEGTASKAEQAAYEAWTPTDPPTGEGFQLWENVSEGSPASPVFPTRDALVEWMSQNRYAAWALDNVRNGVDYMPSALARYNTSGRMQFSGVQD